MPIQKPKTKAAIPNAEDVGAPVLLSLYRNFQLSLKPMARKYDDQGIEISTARDLGLCIEFIDGVARIEATEAYTTNDIVALVLAHSELGKSFCPHPLDPSGFWKAFAELNPDLWADISKKWLDDGENPNGLHALAMAYAASKGYPIGGLGGGIQMVNARGAIPIVDGGRDRLPEKTLESLRSAGVIE